MFIFSFFSFSAVHRTFFTCDKTRVVSFSDDKTVSTWDVPCEQRLHTFSGHSVCISII